MKTVTVQGGVRWRWALLLARLLVLAGVPAGVMAQDAPRAAAPRGAQVTVNFVNADIEGVTRAFAAMINRPIVVDPRVKGTVTVYSEQPQSVREAYASYLSALRGLGFAVVESSGLLKVVPEADAKLQAGTVSVGEDGIKAIKGDQVITQIFPLRYENPNNLVAVLRPLISANNTINANPGSNALVITDYADNLQRIAKIIAALDLPANTDLEIVPLQHAVAADLAPLVQRLVDGGGAAAVPGAPGVASGGTTVVADSRSNSLIVRAPNAARLQSLRATIARLDRPNTLGGNGGMWVVHLKNADAVRLATVVRAAFGAQTSSGGTGNVGGGGVSTPAAPATPATPTGAGAGGASAAATASVTAAAQPSTGGFIQADPATNSLIITAAEPLYKQVRALIDQLDSRRAQVYIESLIVEVTGDDSAEFGFQWQGLLGKSGDKFGVAGGTNFSNTSPSIIDLNVNAASGKGVTLAGGLNVGLLTVTTGVTTLGAIAQMMQTKGDTNIVSAPNMVTLDNEEAKIVVGQNVPFITGQYTNTGGGTGTTNPFQTIERKDVGTTLRIRPQIGEGGTVRMTIFQEQSSVTGSGNAGPTTSKRSIENTVVVDDGAILVLGGLIEEKYETTVNKVPLLGDIPVLGALFRSESRARKRTNQIVFLRPIVLRDADSANRLSLDRYDQLRGEQKLIQPVPSVITPINQGPLLPTPGTKPVPPAGLTNGRAEQP